MKRFFVTIVVVSFFSIPGAFAEDGDAADIQSEAGAQGPTGLCLDGSNKATGGGPGPSQPVATAVNCSLWLGCSCPCIQDCADAANECVAACSNPLCNFQCRQQDVACTNECCQQF